jgi:hypothetical protein
MLDLSIVQLLLWLMLEDSMQLQLEDLATVSNSMPLVQ